MAKKEEKRSDFKDFLGHLEYLGYEIQYAGTEEDERGVHTTHYRRPSLWIFNRFVGVGVSIGYCMGQNAVTYLSDYLKTLNDFNSRSIVSTFYTKPEADRPNLTICAMFAAPYEKKAFGIFMDELHKDHDEMKKVSEFSFYAEDDIVEVLPAAQVS